MRLVENQGSLLPLPFSNLTFLGKFIYMFMYVNCASFTGRFLLFYIESLVLNCDYWPVTKVMLVLHWYLVVLILLDLICILYVWFFLPAIRLYTFLLRLRLFWNGVPHFADLPSWFDRHSAICNNGFWFSCCNGHVRVKIQRGLDCELPCCSCIVPQSFLNCVLQSVRMKLDDVEIWFMFSITVTHLHILMFVYTIYVSHA